MSKITIIEGNSNDKDNVRAIMVKGEKGDMGDLNHNDIIDNLTSTATDKVLSAKQGKVLKDLVDVNANDISVNATSISNETTARQNADNILQNNINSEATTRESADANLQSQISGLASGSPLVASSTSEMTDTTRVYVNTTDGNWYYYNGSAWTIGGVYQATEIEDGSVTADKTNFVEKEIINYVLFDTPQTQYNGILCNRNEETGIVTINGANTQNADLKITTLFNGTLKPGTYVVDIGVQSGTASDTVGVFLNGTKLSDSSTVTLINSGSENNPYIISIDEEIILKRFSLWITSGHSFENYKIMPQIQKGNAISGYYSGLDYIYSFIRSPYLTADDSDILNNLINNNLNSKNQTSLLVPNRLRYLPNREISIYYDNVLFNGVDTEIYNHQSYNNFTHLDDCYRFNKSNVATYNEKLIFNKKDMIRTRMEHPINLIGVDINAGSGVTKKCLFIGDSLTDLGYYTQELLNLFENDVMNIELLGTRGSGLNKNEGRSGWSAYSYTHNAIYGNISNPFFNTSTNSFDFAKYMNDNNYTSVDIVGIFLGTNDRGTIGSTAEEIAENLTSMINSIKAFDSNIKIMLITPPPVCKVGYDYVAWNKSIKVADDIIISNFDSKENENIFIVPAHFNVDPVHDYKMKTIPLNSRSNLTKIVVDDPIHPDIIGFEHIADVIYPYLKYLGSL